MLQANVSSYQQHNYGGSASKSLAACPVFTTAELQFPYSSAQPEFVSLADSADHDHYQLVALALPVTDNSHGDTKALRHQLGLPAQPRLEHVVDHLLQLVATPGLEAALKLPAHDFVVDGLRQGYQCVINSVSKSMAEGSLPNLARESSRLAQEAWVLVQGCKFVRPCQLCFDLEEDTPQGYEVPRMLMTLINAQPSVKRWFIDTLKVTDLHDGAPSIKQLHDNPVTAITSVAK
ncbi:hypothetical protein ABBQ38_006830 [Trebouxia sp. C0009 RCD-2024]